jgi:serralysin
MKPCEDLTQKILSCSCVALLLPQDIEEQEMIEELQSPSEPVFRLAAWGEFRKRWPLRSTLRVRFLNGSSRARSLCVERIRKLDDLCGLAFKIVTSGPSEIRIMFNPSGGHWSYLGTDCRSIPQQFQTMNIGLTERDSSREWDRVVLHEMLHAIGFNHEHQHPRSVIPWNRPAVYRFYSETQGWSRSEIDAQVLRRSTATNIFGSEPDKDSIMMYPIPEELLLDKKFAVGWNYKFSAWDISTIRKVYPL